MSRNVSMSADLAGKVLSVPVQFLVKQETDHFLGLKKRNLSKGDGGECKEGRSLKVVGMGLLT